MRAPRRLIPDRPWLLMALVLAGIVHIVSVLAMPRMASGDAFARLLRGNALNAMHLLPSPRPGAEKFPYSDPALASGVCPYDLTRGPLRVRAKLSGGTFVSVSFHSRRERVYYAMTDKAATRRRFDVVVATAAQLDAIKAKDNPDEPSEELRLTSPGRKGFVFVRVLASDASDLRNAEAQVQSFGCTIDEAAAAT